VAVSCFGKRPAAIVILAEKRPNLRERAYSESEEIMGSCARCILAVGFSSAILTGSGVAAQAPSGAPTNGNQSHGKTNGSNASAEQLSSPIRMVKSPDEAAHDSARETAADNRDERNLQILERATQAPETQARTAPWQTVFAVVGAIFLGWTLYETRRTATAAQKSAEAISNVERAYLYLTNAVALFNDAHPHPDNPPPIPNRSIVYQFHNYGKTPAILRTMSVKAEIRDIPPTRREIELLPAGKLIGTIVVSAGEESIKPGYGFLLSNDHFDAVIANSKSLYFYGRVGYLDIFGSRHETGFCGNYEVLTKTFTATGEPGRHNYNT
jgi:hypothetical protein